MTTAKNENPPMTENPSEPVALLPCPFCGSQPEIEDGGDRPWVIGCRNPDCLVLCDMDGADTKREAIRAWNVRPTAPASSERPWCETCGKTVAEVLCPTCAKWWNDNPPPSSELVEIIETRLLGVDPDDQDVVLEDDDWRAILTALRAQGEVEAERGPKNGVNCPSCGVRLPPDYDASCPDCGSYGMTEGELAALKGTPHV